MTDKKVLYVEDEASLALIVRETLQSRGFEVYHAANGTKALDIYKQVSPDICVLDIMLPGMDGYSLAARIREQHAAVPIIFLTAKTQTKDVIEGFNTGGNDYLKKPFSMEELIVRMENLIEIVQNEPMIAQEKISYSLGGYTFFPNSYEIEGREGTIALSHREAKLLQLLCQHQNATCERKEILMAIWGDDSYFNSRTLDVYINKLRKLFRTDSSVEIVTLKGVGYLFKVETKD